MIAPQPGSRAHLRWTGVTTAAVLACTAMLVLSASCTRPASPGAGTSVHEAVLALEEGRPPRGTVTITGVVTDDDPGADLTLVADDTRGILVSHAPWTP